MRLLVGFCCSLLAVVLLLQAWAASAEKTPDEMLNKYCTVCHNLNRVREEIGHRESLGWVQYISRMQENGADISDKEKYILAKYLGEMKEPSF